MTKPAEIPSTMRALVAYGKHDYRLEPAYPVPDCGDDEMLVKSEGSGICAGDLKNYQGASMYWGGDGMMGICRPPFIPGHEFVGRIVKTGKNVSGFQPGERVVAEQIVPCGHCRFCRTGKYWMCKNRGGFGFYKELNGGMGEYVRFLPETRVYKIPEELPFEKALLIEPYACAKHAVDRADIHCEDVVVISGAGTLGLAMITYARMKNPAKLIVLDINPQRLEKAAEFGADLVMNPAETDAVQAIRDLTDGYGCDIYIEATGHSASVVTGLNAVRKLGVFVEFGVFAENTTVNWSLIGDRKELDIRGAHLSPYCYPFVIENIVNGRLKTDGVVTSVFPIEQWEKAFEYAGGQYGDYKVAIRF